MNKIEIKLRNLEKNIKYIKKVYPKSNKLKKLYKERRILKIYYRNATYMQPNEKNNIKKAY